MATLSHYEIVNQIMTETNIDPISNLQIAELAEQLYGVTINPYEIVNHMIQRHSIMRACGGAPPRLKVINGTDR